MPRKRKPNSAARQEPDDISPPTVYVIAGPNGAGKTTFASEFLPDFVECREFLNADLIAAGLAPFDPETQDVRAARLLLTRIRELTAARLNFGFETTLAGRSYARQFVEMRRQGYRVLMFFLWLPSDDMAVARVANRVRQGGHNVPERTIRRRFVTGIKNFLTLYEPQLDGWWLYGASHFPPRLIAAKNGGKLEMLDSAIYEQIMKNAEVS